jgi:hypothetical protein
MMKQRLMAMGLALTGLMSLADEIASPANATTNVVERRVHLLKANLPSGFELRLWPNLSNVEKPFYALTLTVAPVPGEDRSNPFVRRVQITKEQAGKIIDHLAVEGFLAQAVDRQNPPAIPDKWPEGYVLEVSTCPSGLTSLVEPLGWNGKMLKRLDDLRKALEGDAGKGMDLLVGRLGGLRVAWEKSVAAESSGGPTNGAEMETVRWGESARGLQLGISPMAGTNGVTLPVVDGQTIRLETRLRNSGETPVRILAPIYRCLLGGGDPLFVSQIVFTPKNGGPSVVATYQGWNHLSLLDVRRKPGEQPQRTLNESFGSTDVQLSAEDARRMSKVIVPGKEWRRQVEMYLVQRPDRSSFWQLEKGKTLPAGAYAVRATLTASNPQSEWKGEIASGELTVEIK